ncbi:Predicted dehydrogenase [Mariniphaga anaerophila]|uniref:Predicted dehydrogenase n=1 Tax=Mariniphaga anaerophila TaxID=1484053 RepID=A0A1M4T5B9_9BACT|nr:Gfo/Idh/MocA family oxidoreductase [Mariniphaga anaerophila]SHE39732.1 Predicted dehydrogenase [Mariniphaga anaerophila]
MDRRSFIQKTATGTAGMVAAFHVSAFSRNTKIKIGLIGCGWYGMVITTAALKAGGAEVVAVCDVDSEHLQKSAGEIENSQGNRPKEFKDYRDLLELKNLDAVMIGTPPQWHALQFIAACKKGLDIYCEKPLAYDVEEGKAMMKAAKEAGNIVQIGFQRRQSAAFKKAKQLIEDGTTGKIHQIGAQIHYNPAPGDTAVQEPPQSLDWDAWCGPAPKLPYRPSIGHKAWRLEKEYGNGHLVDWGIHHIDIIRTIMSFDVPESFQTNGSLDILHGKITTPDTLNSTMHFAGCPVIWQHRLWGSGDLNPQFNNGVFFYGEKATLFASDNKLVLMPAGKNQQQQEMNIPSPDMQQNHVAEFIRAVQERNSKVLSCKIEDAWKSTTTVQLAMASYYTESDVKWDAAAQTVRGNSAAEKLLARPYRQGYKRPEV